MSMPAYVSPDQLMRDRADYARRGVTRGRAVVVARCADAIIMVAENPSRTLRKTSEIHDRIGFAAVGRYHEFERLRVAGIREADLRAYAYDHLDVTALGLVGTYSQVLGSIYSNPAEKPYEVEIAVAELGLVPSRDRIYKISFDGSVTDGTAPTVLGALSPDRIDTLNEFLTETSPLDEAVRCAAAALSASSDPDPDELEVSLLDRRTGGRRTFRRLSQAQIQAFWKDPA